MRAFFWITFPLFFSLSVLAEGWSPEARYLSNSYDLPIKDSMVSTIWGNIIKKQYAFLPKTGPKIEIGQIANPYFEAGHIKYLLGEDTYRPEGPRPLIFFNPGVFVNLEGRQPKDIIKRFTRLGYRVVTFANPLHGDFISLRPKFEVMDLRSQAEAYYYASRGIYRQLRQKGLVTKDVHLIGVSYGGLLSTIQYYLDSQNEEPLYTKGMTAISPPFDFIASASNLHNIVHESRHHKINNKKTRQIYAYFQIRSLKDESKVTERIREKSKALLGHLVFKDSLVKTLESFSNTYQLALIPESKEERKKWREQVNFIPAFQQLAPTSYEALKNSPERFLYHWAEMAIESGHQNIRIISAHDDVINNGIDPRLEGSPYLYGLDWGGHYGFMGHLWFDNLLITEFSLKRP